jgi:chemotaxis protein MotA
MTPRGGKKLRLDFTTVAGVPLGIALVLLGQIIEGGSPRSVFQLTAALTVFGGTLAAVLVSFTLNDVKAARDAFTSAFVWSGESPKTTIDLVMHWSGRARRQGLAKLEDELPAVSEPFLKKGLWLAVDGVQPHAIREILELENVSREEEDERPAGVYEAAAGYAPTFGILGAVLGLIQVMQHLSDPSRIGEGIAVAFVATVYGVGVANLLLLPIATKLRTKAHYEARRRELIIEGIIGITEGLNPRTLHERLVGCSGRPELSEEWRRDRVA